MSSYQKKTADLLRRSIEKLCNKYGLERLGFLTLTFADHVTDPKEGHRRYNSLRTGVLKKRYLDYVRVPERQKSGRLHYHLVVVLHEDIRTGFDFAAVKVGVYNSANKVLRAEWAFWRKTAPKYHFGRTELMPIKSNSAAISKYVGKYILKHVEKRLPEDKGMRLVEYSKGARDGTTNFAWVGVGSWLWREKLRVWAYQNDIKNEEEMKQVFGKNWGYHCRAAILRTKLSFWPTTAHMAADISCTCSHWGPEDAVNITLTSSAGRDWHKEVRAARSAAPVVPQLQKGTGRIYKLAAKSVSPAVSESRVLQKFFGVQLGQMEIPLHDRNRANKERRAGAHLLR
ncbi:MAG: hypothetical protein ACFUZC_20145 [Chthoniobacteraceae bacterium]